MKFMLQASSRFKTKCDSCPKRACGGADAISVYKINAEDKKEGVVDWIKSNEILFGALITLAVLGLKISFITFFTCHCCPGYKWRNTVIVSIQSNPILEHCFRTLTY